MVTFPIFDYRARLFSIGYGIALFLWLSSEDQNALFVALLGMIGTGLIIWAWASAQALRQSHFLLWGTLLGALGGAGAAFATTLLMFFKTAWHSHIAPDFPIPMMLAMLERLPLWAIAGALIGGGLALWRQRP